MTKHKKIILSITYLPLILVLVSLACGAALFGRTIAIPAYVSLFYTNGVSKDFDHNFSVINGLLHTYDISLQATKATCHNGVSDGGDVDYHHFSATVPCQRAESSNMIAIPSQAVTQLTKLLVQSGWKSGSPSLPDSVATTYTGFGDALAYRFDGKTYCEIGFGNTYPNTESGPTQVYEACQRDVSFFGGNGG